MRFRLVKMNYFYKNGFVLKLLKTYKNLIISGASTAEAQVRVAVEVSEQFIALTGKSTKYTTYPGVVNPKVLAHFQ